MDEKIESIITRYFNNECTESEIIVLGKWLHESPENARLFFEMENTMLTARGCSPIQRADALEAWEKLDKRIQAAAPDTAPALSSDTRYNRFGRRLWTYVAAACVAAVAVIAGIRIFHTAPAVPDITVAAIDTPREVTLPDSTVVWLNAHTTLTYPQSFTDRMTSRRVTLDGEGYFEVTHNPSKPFIVTSPVMTVTVLGTKFDIQTGADRSNYVSLIDGSVQVSLTNDANSVILSPGQKATLDPANDRFEISEINTRLDAVWRNYVIPFHDADIMEIKKSLEYLYGVTILVSDKIDHHRKYSGGTYRFERIDSALEYISLAIPITYRVEGDTVILDAR